MKPAVDEKMNIKAALTSAFFSLLLYAAGIVPLLGQAVMLFAPVPLIISYVRHGRQTGLAAIGLSTLVVFVVGGLLAAVIMLFGFGLLAMIAGWGMLRRLRHEQVVMLASILPTLLLTIFLLTLLINSGKDPIKAFEDYLKGSITEVIKLYTAMGLKDAAAFLSSLSERFIYYFVRLMPSLILSTALLQTACCYGLARSIILRKDGDSSRLVPGPFSEWHAPDKWVWVLIVSLGLILTPAKIMGWNLVIILFTIYTVQGLALLEYFFKKGGLPPFARGLIMGIILALPSALILPVVGVVDIWADFRKVRAPLR